MPLSLSVCPQSGPPICTSFWAFLGAFKALRALKGPQIIFSHILMHRPYQDLQNLKFSCLLIPFSHKVVPQKASGRVGSGVGSGRIPHFNWSIYRGGNFFFFESGVKLDEESIENGLKVQKFLFVCLFWGGCHHPNEVDSNQIPAVMCILFNPTVSRNNENIVCSLVIHAFKEVEAKGFLSRAYLRLPNS